MGDNDTRDSEKEELEREARFLRRTGIAGIVSGCAMFVPALISQRVGYDMKTIDTPYEMLALASGLAAFVLFSAGALSYVEGNVEYLRRENNNTEERK